LFFFFFNIFSDIVAFAAPEKTAPLRSNEPLVRYVLSVTAIRVESIRLEPDYKQLAYSKRTFKQLTDITKVIYERCIHRNYYKRLFSDMCSNSTNLDSIGKLNFDC